MVDVGLSGLGGRGDELVFEGYGADLEVVPRLVELEVAVPRLTPPMG